MKRSELYKRVWEVPLSRLGPELNLSGVGLAKLCKRHSIPVPPRGHWAKLEAGKESAQPPLSDTEDDCDVGLPQTRPEQGALAAGPRLKAVREALESQESNPPLTTVSFRESLEGCHQVITATKKHFYDIRRKVEEQRRISQRPPSREPQLHFVNPMRTNCGRYQPEEDGCLRLAVGLDDIDWILRFHHTLFQSLQENGCSVSASKDYSGRKVNVRRAGGEFHVSFAQSYAKVGGRSSTAYVLRDTFTLKLERHLGGVTKKWTGTTTELERDLPNIVATILALLDIERERRHELQRRQNEKEEQDRKRRAESAAWFAEQEAIAARKKARKEQVARAKALLESVNEYEALQRLLSCMEKSLGSEDSAVQMWVTVVRGQLEHPIDVLKASVRADACGTSLPGWWPQAVTC